MHTPCPRFDTEPFPAQVGVVVLYEDFDARQRIERVYDHLLADLSREFGFTAAWCGFHDLTSPSVARAMAAAANMADLVLVSVDLCPMLPPALVDWLERWAAGREPKDAALALLLHDPAGALAPSPVLKFLRAFSKRARLDFVHHVSHDGPSPAPGDLPAASPRSPRFAAASASDAALAQK